MCWQLSGCFEISGSGEIWQRKALGWNPSLTNDSFLRIKAFLAFILKLFFPLIYNNTLKCKLQCVGPTFISVVTLSCGHTVPYFIKRSHVVTNAFMNDLKLWKTMESRWTKLHNCNIRTQRLRQNFFLRFATKVDPINGL